MADQIARRNERVRAIAEKNGQATYQHEVVDHWPACVTCAAPIRYRHGAGLGPTQRVCACPGVRWYSTGSGWHREATTSAADQHGVGS